MCCSFFLKTMMFIFNGVIFLAGVAMLAMGIWLNVDCASLMELLGSIRNVPGGLAQLAHVSYLLIGVGVVLLVVGFLGCCGAIRESRCMLLTFFILLLIIFVAEVAAAVLVFIFQTEAANILKDLDDKIVENFEQNSPGDLSPLWYSTMHDFQCCGYHNYTNFRNTSVYPPSCCNSTLVVPAGCTTDIAEKSNIEGCFEKILQLIKDNAVIIGAVAGGIAVIEVAAMVVSMVLYNNIERK
ncbi:unnamed protein product [Lota lota]